MTSFGDEFILRLWTLIWFLYTLWPFFDPLFSELPQKFEIIYLY